MVEQGPKRARSRNAQFIWCGLRPWGLQAAVVHSFSLPTSFNYISLRYHQLQQPVHRSLPLSTHIEYYRKTMTVSRYKYKSWQTKTVILSVTYVLYNSYTPYSCYLTLVGKCGRQWFPKSKQIKKKNKTLKIQENQIKLKQV